MAIETILFTVGTGDVERTGRLAEETIDVAGPTGVAAVIGHVFTKDEHDDTFDNLDFGITIEEASADNVTRRRATVREPMRRFDDADIDYVVYGRVSHHGERLVGFTGKANADYLIVGSRKYSSTGKAIFRSAAREVTLEALCPVTFVRTDIKRRVAAA